MEHEKNLARVDGERCAPSAGSTAQTSKSGAPAIETVVRRIVDGVIQAKTAGEADNFVRELLEPLRLALDVDHYDHATAVHAMEREREYRRILWAAAASVWPEPLRVNPTCFDIYDPSLEIQKRYTPTTRDLLFYADPVRMTTERTTGADYAVDPAVQTPHSPSTRDPEPSSVSDFAALKGAQAQTK